MFNNCTAASVLSNIPPFAASLKPLATTSLLNLKNNLSCSLGKDERILSVSFFTVLKFLGLNCLKIFPIPFNDSKGSANCFIFKLGFIFLTKFCIPKSRPFCITFKPPLVTCDSKFLTAVANCVTIRPLRMLSNLLQNPPAVSNKSLSFKTIS